MEFRMLGPLEVISDGGVPIVLQQRLRAILSVLLLRRGEPCPRDWLIDAIWGDHSLKNPDVALRTSVYGLRRALGDDGVRVETHDAGYLIHVVEGELDLAQWQRLYLQGRAALDRRDAAGAVRLLESALRLWREPVTWDHLPDTPAVAREIEALASSRADAMEGLVDARLACGHHHTLLPELRATVTATPLREHAWAQLMLALYRCGHRAEALAAYTECRRALVAELGVEPSSELVELLRRIHDSDPSLTLAAPRRSAGSEPLPPWIPLSQVPAEPPDFTGRAADTAALDGLLSAHSMTILLIRGTPGAGKTTLAKHVAHQARGRFPDGQLWVWLGGPEEPRDPREILGEILRELGVPPDGIPAGGAEREAMYRSLLAARKVLVVADDAASAGQVRALLPPTAGSAVIVTSRFRLADLEGARAHETGPLDPPDALAMLGKIIGRERAEADPQAAAEIAAACGYLPLPLRIAAARLADRPQLSLRSLANALADPGRALRELTVGDQSMRDRIAVSYRALSGRQQRAWRLLALHGPKEMPAWLAAALQAEPGAAGITEQLAAAGLLTAGGDSASPRYRIPGLLRAFAAEQLAGEEAAPAARALDDLYAGWLELADQADQRMPRIPYVAEPPRLAPAVVPESAIPATREEAADWFALETPSLLATVRRALADGRRQLAADLADRMLAWQCAHGRHDDADQLWAALAAAAARAEDALAGARARYRQAVLAMDRGQWPAAARYALDCALTFRLARDHAALAAAQCLAARCAEADWDLPAALQRAQSSLDSARQAGDRRLQCLSLCVLGTVLASLGSGEDGIATCGEAQRIAEADGGAELRAAANDALKRARHAARHAARA
jgi:DNA-binding SARP family transcriptional activator